MVVDSPPGAGKSTLVVRAVRETVADGDQRVVVAQTNSQVDDLIERLAAEDPGMKIGRLSSQQHSQLSDRLADCPNVVSRLKIGDLEDCAVVIGTAAKWATIGEGTWSGAIIDEAYQMRSDMLLRVANRFDHIMFVGDPGQLDPFATVDTDSWKGLAWDPSMSAVEVMLANNSGIPVHRLPVSWRLPATAAPLVSAAFYPFNPFDAGTTAGQRRMTYSTRGLGKPIDKLLDIAAETGWGWYELPARHTLRTDREAMAAIAAIACRLLERGTETHSERGTSTLTPDRIAIGVAHRDQTDAVRAALAGTIAAAVTVDTANRLQGREYDVTVVLHPLSGRRDASAFHLEAGRLCVLASRHRHACIMVGRAGISELLDAHPSAEPVHLGVALKFPDGWEANQRVLGELAECSVRA
ncbi:helicase [Nocardia stercoris]|uniref:Helicase n=2 Tax=Nocardia stercoris TaxID=2483361 RepID=A0A3M2LIH9_9NOCA|nr:helicase [Nocardia stercoris]